MSKGTQRRQLRETVVQFLYSIGTNSSEEDEEKAIRLILEALRTKILLSRCKAVLHLEQGRAKRLPALEELVRQTFRIDEIPTGQNPLTPIRELAKSETKLQAELESLRLEIKGNKHPARLQDLLQRCEKLNQESRSALARLTTPRPSLPAVESTRTMALELCSQIPRYSERLLDALSETPSEAPELAPLRKAQKAEQDQRDEITALVEAMNKHITEIDTAIESSVDNYSPQRIDRVDRAILRLGTYELLKCPEVPPAAAINEAIEIAREYGSTESPRFINGILDRIQKNQAASQSTGNL